ncbi:MAG: zinc-binding alcohol dehydrogenase family protein [Asticcacaulis sp.]
MKAAIVHVLGQEPTYGEFDDPIPAQGEVLLRVNAAAMSHVVKGQASGQHYSSASDFPFIAGIDGVGQLKNGRRVYFVLPCTPFGSMAEKTVVNSKQCITLPENLDDVSAAALANPGMSSWAAYVERAGLKRGETVLVNGATGTSGRLAIQIAKYMGAKKVIATGRNLEALNELSMLGADVVIPLTLDTAALDEALQVQFSQGIHVVIDYLWGEPAEHLLMAAARANEKRLPIRYVHIGSVSGPFVNLSGDVLRATPITLMGSGLGSVSPVRLIHVLNSLFKAATQGDFRIATTPVPLSQVDMAWSLDDSRQRTVFTMG